VNRADRRRLARERGIKPGHMRELRRAERVAQKLEAKVLKMGAPAARKLLAEWAAKGGTSQADVDLLNGVASDRAGGTL
jgi:enhancing lycopene biosynthesis protein 2